jgi:hypothetical protein
VYLFEELEYGTSGAVNRTPLIHSQFKLLHLSNSSPSMFKTMSTTCDWTLLLCLMAAVTFITSVCRNVCTQLSTRFQPGRCTRNFIGGFHENLSKIPKLKKRGTAIWPLYEDQNVFLNLETLNCQTNEIMRLLGWPRKYKHYANASHFLSILALFVWLCVMGNRDIYLQLWCSQNELQYTAVVFP